MIERFISLGVRELFGGARRGQPIIAAFGAAVSIWGLFRRINRSQDKLVYSRVMRDGETIRIRAFRADAPLDGTETER